MIKLKAEKAKLTLEKTEVVTSGASKAFEVEFEFSEEWQGLTKTAVFKAGEVTVAVPLSAENRCKVPSSVLKKSGVVLYAGVKGKNDSGVILPTIYTAIREIRQGVGMGETAEEKPDGGESSGGACSEDVFATAEEVKNLFN